MINICSNSYNVPVPIVADLVVVRSMFVIRFFFIYCGCGCAGTGAVSIVVVFFFFSFFSLLIIPLHAFQILIHITIALWLIHNFLYLFLPLFHFLPLLLSTLHTNLRFTCSTFSKKHSFALCVGG